MENGILEETRAFVTALERGDVPAAGEVYTDDARLLADQPSRFAAARRSKATGTLTSSLASQPRVRATLARVDRRRSSELGRYVVSLQGEAKPAVEHGSYLVLPPRPTTARGDGRRGLQPGQEPVSARHISRRNDDTHAQAAGAGSHARRPGQRCRSAGRGEPANHANRSRRPSTSQPRRSPAASPTSVCSN